MSVQAGQRVELSIEKPAAGGRMIARHDGQVILVLGAVPGERVVAEVQRVERQLAFATTVDVLEPSADRRPSAVDPLCGGCVYAHVAYGRQVRIKGEVIRDAFARLGRIPVAGPLRVAESPEAGYRMRARLHVRDGRVGFYREGTHDLCDASTTGQLGTESLDSVSRAVRMLERSGCTVSSVEVAENIAATERIAHFTLRDGALTEDALGRAMEAGALAGCSARVREAFRAAGVPVVSDPLPVLTSGRARSGVLERHAESFFQANRFLLPELVSDVVEAASGDGEVLDLYAGVGLFSVSLAACGRTGINAVEGDRNSGRDLQRNAAPWRGRVRVWVDSVEGYLRRRRGAAPLTIIVDPPRTGISREAMTAIARHGATRVVYVSCDPATMARDARRLLDAGYGLRSLRAFDLFPNTPHVESSGVFER